MSPREALDAGLAALEMPLAEGARVQLLRYVGLLTKWNKTYNLTAIREPGDMVTQHLLDSLAIVPHLPIPGGSDALLADVGAGAGLPGIPLAIARPSWRIALNDSKQKKAAFMRQAAIELGLGNVTVHETRVEAWRPIERFALVVSRAFAELASFLSACRHLLAPGGALVAMKGALPSRELERVPAVWRCAVVRLRVPYLEAERHLVICREGA